MTQVRRIRFRNKSLAARVNRPVNIQGTRDWLQYLRGDLLGQPYLTLFGSVASS